MFEILFYVSVVVCSLTSLVVAISTVGFLVKQIKGKKELGEQGVKDSVVSDSGIKAEEGC